MKIEYLHHLPKAFISSAMKLYFQALRDKFEPILGSGRRAHEALADSVDTTNCLVAVCNRKVVGIMGIQSGKRGFINPGLKSMARIYGMFSGMVRLWGLALLSHSPRADELYVDGVAVDSEMRGRGIGSHFFNLLEQTALKAGIQRISLDVIDTNVRAKALYSRLGFVEVKNQTLWPLTLFIRFPFASATFMVKSKAAHPE